MHARIANRNRFIRSESADKQKALKLLLEQTTQTHQPWCRGHQVPAKVVTTSSAAPPNLMGYWITKQRLHVLTLGASQVFTMRFA